ncbi:MAG TPA: Uma2 family endonuclease [Bacteroidia bacterium]|nr:Uma2 family endonuclease [Bacteroidia bacterium]
MKSPVLDAMLDSPVLPELIQEVQRAMGRERRLREKFYAEITPEHKWEFIQGEIVMHSPALSRHLLATKQLYDLMSAYVRVHSFGVVHIEKAMTSFPRNDYEPDVMFFGEAKAALISPDTLRFPIPDLVVEVLFRSTEKRDRGVKFEDYALHGVGEYWIVDTEAETVELHRLDEDRYPAAPRQSEGELVSEVIPGFAIPVEAIFDEEANLAALRQILG